MEGLSKEGEVIVKEKEGMGQGEGGRYEGGGGR